MYVSRSETHQQAKKRKGRRMKRLLALNLTMLAVIVILVAVWLASGDTNKGMPGGSADSGANSPSEGESPPGDPDGAVEPDNNGTENNVTGSNGTNGGIVDGTDDGGGAQNQDGRKPEQEPDPNPSPDNDPAPEPDKPTGEDQGTPGNGGSTGSDGSDGSGSGSDGGIVPDPPVTGKTIRLSFVGDILLAASVDKIMQSKGYDYPYAKTLPFLKEPDLMAGNLETPITLRGVPAQDKQFVFKGSPKSLPALKEAGFDVVSLANNHTLDQGVEGLLDTIGYLDEIGMPNMGGGSDDKEAFEPAILEAKGIKVAYIGLSRVLPVAEWKATKDRAGVAETYDSTQAKATIRSARKQADLVIVMVHWGKERKDYPEKYQQQLAREYIDAGADLIIGSHPHVLQGFEQYKGKWISYSLGNFIFNKTKTPKTDDTGVLDAVCTKEGSCSLKFNPMRSVDSQPAPLTGNEAKTLLAYVSKISINAQVDSEGNVRAKE
ncbi:CapA family protein [Paenibacillus spongiae]|uniref:CapA family protein n=1 Tax=Paenibacillus spongiae TaxID=2909671 RepID=A0ABY5SEG1_9BACL|nr:CapA family protein [Paenibacillus spongiae]UVI31913.1 CapA family protein [Paenibacillus spongiae]